MLCYSSGEIVSRRDYTPISDVLLEELQDIALEAVDSSTEVFVPAEKLYRLTAEVIDLRDRVFHLSLRETVDQILVEELDDDGDSFNTKIFCSGERFMFPVSGEFSPEDDTIELPRIQQPAPSNYLGRRIRRCE